MTKSFKKGFTIVEMVVVVAVIGILAAISYVSYQRVVTDGDQGAMQAEYNDIRNAVELYEARHSEFPTCPSGVECNLSEITSKLGVSGVQTVAQDGSPISYMADNEPGDRSWAIRMYDPVEDGFCKMGNNIRSNWLNSHPYCWE